MDQQDTPNGPMDRQARVIELRQQGHTLQSIADQLGYAGHAGVWQVLQRHVWNNPATEMAEQYRLKMLEETQVERELLVALIAEIKQETDVSKRLDMIGKLSKSLGELRNQEAKLTGANAPEKTESSINLGHEDWLSKLK